MTPTDKEKAERAKERANEKSTASYELASVLCPACNEPVTHMEPNPNEFVPIEGNDQAAYEFSPSHIIEHGKADTAWDAVHIVPRAVETHDGDTQLRVGAYKHDYSSEDYQAWQEQLEEIEENEKRAEENKGLGEFA